MPTLVDQSPGDNSATDRTSTTTLAIHRRFVVDDIHTNPLAMRDQCPFQEFPRWPREQFWFHPLDEKLNRLLFCTPIRRASSLHRPVKPAQSRFLVRKQASHDDALAPGPAAAPAGHDSAEQGRAGAQQADHDSNVRVIAQGEQICDRQIMIAWYCWPQFPAGHATRSGSRPEASAANGDWQVPTG